MENSSHSDNPRIAVFLLLSLLVHSVIVIVMLALSTFQGKGGPLDFTAKREPERKNILVSKMDRKELEQILRTVGKKDGRKDIFSLPVKQADRNSFSSLANPPKVRPPKTAAKSGPNERPQDNATPPPPSFALSNLGLDSQKGLNIRPNELNVDQDSLTVKNSSQKKRPPPPSFQKYLQGKFKENEALAEAYPELFKSSDFQITVETPLGVDADKLNSTELIFYGFHKRVFESYVASIFKAYEDFKMKNPHVDLTRTGKQILRAKIRYDEKGNIKEIIGVEDSSNEKIREFFQSILEKNRIPNPPKEILNKEGGFNLEFQLLLNV